MKRPGSHKIKAGALQFTLFIGVLILLILTAFVLLSYTHQRFRGQNNLLKETIQTADNAIQYALQSDLTFTDQPTTLKAPFFKEYEEVKLTAKPWGLYTQLKSIASAKNYSFERNALIGGKVPEESRNALVLANTFSPLVLVGTSKIVGDSRLSEYGVKPGSMGSAYFTGNTLIAGRVQVDNREALPQLPNSFINQLKRLSKRLPEGSETVLNYKGKPFHNSFKEETQWILDSRELILTDTITGNIIIHSDTKIRVETGAYLKDVILTAPEVVLQSGTKGNFQVFATKSIELKSQVNLQYPSALVLITESKRQLKYTTEADLEPTNSIKIGSGTTIKGSVVYLGDEPNLNYEPEVFIDRDAYLYGELYCEQNVELKGSVFGSVMTRAFVSREFGSVYRNHLYNGVIDVSQMTPEFAGLPVSSTFKSVAKWIY